jgi:hypothetical protein
MALFVHKMIHARHSPDLPAGSERRGMELRDPIVSLSAEIAGEKTPGPLARGINLALDDPVKDA